MNEIVKRYGELPKYAQDLMDDMFQHARMFKNGHIHKLKLTDEESKWLKNNGFTVQYDNRISEYKITW